MVDHAEGRIPCRERQSLALFLSGAIRKGKAGRGKEPPRHRSLGWGKEAVPLELEHGDPLPSRLAFPEPEPHNEGGIHLHRRAGDLAVTLGEVGVASRKERPAHEHGNEEGSTLRELLDVDVPRVFTGGNRPQASAPHRPTGSAQACRDRAGRLGRQHKPPSEPQFFLAREHLLGLGDGQGDAHGPHRGIGMDADPGQVARGRNVSDDVPVQDGRSGDLVPQEAEPRDVDRIGEGVGDDIDDMHLEKVSRLGSLDRHRPGQWMDKIQVQRTAREGRDDVPLRGSSRDLAIEGVAKRLSTDQLRDRHCRCACAYRSWAGVVTARAWRPRARLPSHAANAMSAALVASESVKWGPMAASDTAISPRRLGQLRGRNMWPATAAERPAMPITAEMKLTTMSTSGPCRSSAGWYTKRNGARKPPIAMREACQPVVIGLAPAI